MAGINEEARIPVYINDEQAKSALKTLTAEAAKWKKQMFEAMSAGDLTGMKQAEDQLKKIGRQTANIKKEAFDANKVLQNLAGASLTDLRKTETALRKQMEGINRNTKEWKEYQQQLQKVVAEKRKVAGEMNGLTASGGPMAKLTGAFKGLLPVLSVGAVVAGIRQIVRSYASLDDKFADVMKTTGLTRTEVSKLNKELQAINTRSSQEELLDLARVAGKLGITAEKEVLGFVRAADKIKVALSEDLGGNVEESINSLGKLVDIFKLKEQYGIEEALLKVGSAINSLGAAGTANEAYLVEFAKRVAGIAPSADISIQKILGLAATLDELGQTSEMSTTAVAQVIGKMFKETATFAGIAKMEVEDFTNLLNTDANEAFIKLLEGAKGSGEGFGEMAKNLDKLGLDGARSTQVLGALADNIDKLREKQRFSNEEFEKGTSILAEFATKNDTVQAGMDKFGKWIKNQYLNLLDGVNERLRTQVSIHAEQIKQFGSAQQNLIPLIQEYETLKAKTELSADEQLRMKTIIGNIAEITPFAISQMDDYGNAIDISTEKAKEWIEAQKVFLKYQNAEAIKDTEDKLEKINKKLEKQTALKQHLVFSAQKDYELGYRTVDAYDERIAKVDAERESLIQLRQEQTALLEVLQGDFLKVPEKTPTNATPVGTRKTVGNAVFEWDGKNWNEVDRIEPTFTGGGTPDNPITPMATVDQVNIVNEKAVELDALKAMEADYTKFVNDEVNKQIDILAKQYDLEKEIAAARIELKDMQVEAVGQLASALAGMFEQGSAAQIAAIAIEKAIAIAQIWINYAREMSAISLAAANIAAMPIPGARVAAAAYMATMSAKAKTQAGINTGIIVAQTVASAVSSGSRKKKDQYFDGGHTGPGGKYEPAGIVHKREYVIPSEGTENQQLRPFIDIMEIARRNGSLARLDLRQIVQTIPAKGYSAGGFSSSSSSAANSPLPLPTLPSATSDPEIKQLIQLVVKMTKEIRENPPRLPIDQFERERKKYIDIQQTKGL